MRRNLAVPLLAIGLAVVAVAGCSSSAQAKKTLTEVVTVTGTSPASGGASVTVISPVSPTPTASGSATGSAGTTGGTATTGAPASSSASPTGSSPAASTKASTSASSSMMTSPTGKIVKVNPLKADCAQLLDAQDVQKVLGATISTSVAKFVDVANPQIGRTGLLRCRYGASSSSAAAPVSVALADYKSADAAKAQMKHTQESLGGTASSTFVQGYPATVIIQAGGLLVMTYDTWTLSVAVADKLAPNTDLPNDLTQLATMVLLRVLKSG